MLTFHLSSMKRYYEILGLKEGATKREIKQAYRRMAMRYHPDLNPGNDTSTQFREVLEAYEYLMGIRQMNQGRGLSEEELRRFYDLMQKAAEEKARQNYRRKVWEFKKAKERKQAQEYKKGIILFAVLLVSGLAIWLGYSFYKQLVINSDPIYAEAEVTGLSMKRMNYRFISGDSTIKARSYVSAVEIEMLSGNGMPLKTGDRFEIIYSASHPMLHQINFEKVSSATMSRYLRMVGAKLNYYYDEEWNNLSEDQRQLYASCLSMLIFTNYGYDGLSTVYFGEENFLNNFRHNSLRWYFMRNSQKFQQLLADCSPVR